MKCPNCGRDNDDGAKFCKYCGCTLSESYPPPYYNVNMNPPEPQKKSKFAAGLRAIVMSLVFVGLLFGCQSCVTSGYVVSLTRSITMQDLSSEEAITALYESIYAKVAENTTLIIFIANLLTVLITCLVFRLRRRNPRIEVSCYKINNRRIPSFVLFGFALNLFISLTISIIPFPESWVTDFNNAYSDISTFTDMTELAFSLISIALVTGITEEIVFRGVSMKLLLPVFGKIPSVIITALIFGLAHGTPIAMCYSFVVGLVFGIMYTVYGSVVPSMVCHISFNMASYLVASVPNSNGAFAALYVIAAAMLILFTYRIFIHYPTFTDVFYDCDDRIEPINEREREIVSELKDIQKRIDSDDVENIVDDWNNIKQREKELADEWKKNRLEAKQNKNNKK